MGDKIQSFTDLIAWRQAHDLVLGIYKFSEKFPQKEAFGITNQMRRAAVSITSNIAEGFSRTGKKDKFHFYCIALGSLTELQSQLLIARDLKYLINNDFDNLAKKSIYISKLINGLKKSIIPRTPNT
jgi:four helix bundle protein